jgi:S-DNA-T family DNA segregation ATPase FtsK/SpoIIIE
MARTATKSAKATHGRSFWDLLGRDPSDDSEFEPTIFHRLGWTVMLGALLFVIAALVSYSPADPPATAVWPQNTDLHNWCGTFGAHIAHYGLEMFGLGLWMLAFGLASFLVATGMGYRVPHPFLRAIGLVLLAAAVSGMQHLLLPHLTRFPEGSGGLIGIVTVHHLSMHFGRLGAGLIFAAAGWIGMIVAFDGALALAPRAAAASVPVLHRVFIAPVLGLVRFLLSIRPEPKVRLNDIDDDARLKEMPNRPRVAKNAQRSRRTRRGAAEEAGDQIDFEDPDAEAAGPPEIVDEPDDIIEEPAEERSNRKRRKAKRSRRTRRPKTPVSESIEPEIDDEPLVDAPAVHVPTAAAAGPVPVDRESLREKIAKLPIRHADVSAATPAPTAQEDDVPEEQDLSGYQFPTLDLLEEPEANFTEKMKDHVRSQAEDLAEALQTYGIDGSVVGIDSGPVITMYEVALAPGTKVNSVNTVSSDIARALGSINIRVVPNIQGKTTIGIEVPNQEKEKVRLKELMIGCRQSATMKLPMYLGKDASGAPITADLTKMPHMLIAGTTGSGKSVCMNSIIMSFLYKKRPDELKLVLVDPKMVEMSQFRDIPHLMCPVVTEMSRATAILEWAVTKMDERYELLAEAGCRDISAYNNLTWEELRERFDPQTEEQAARIPRHLPYMVFIIDELADLMMTNKDVEHSIVRLAQKSRAVGLHLILATQRPQANVVTGLIKSNMPCRIAFKVASSMDSRIVLDQKGAELLLGQGDMLYLSPRSHDLVRCQGTLVDDSEIRAAVKFLKSVATQSFERQLMQIRTADQPEVVEGDPEIKGKINERDPLFEKAVEMVILSGRGSVSMLQRQLAVGYTRASRLIEQMGQAGIIGEYKGSQARDVVMTPEEWEVMKRMIAEEESEGTVFEGAGDASEEAEAVDAASDAADATAPFEAKSMDTAPEAAAQVEPDESDDADEDEEDLEALEEDEGVEYIDAADADDEEEDEPEDDDEYEYEYEYVEEYEDVDEGDDDEEEDAGEVSAPSVYVAGGRENEGALTGDAPFKDADEIK